jgi:hypothetical protein
MDSNENSQDLRVCAYDPEPGSLRDLSDKHSRGVLVTRLELIEALQSHRDHHIPGDIAPLICGHLRRDIKSRPGRHARRKEQVDFYASAMRALYKEELLRLRKLKKEHGRLHGLVPRELHDMPPNQIAAALTARKFPKLNITGRTVQNFIAAHKSSTNK